MIALTILSLIMMFILTVVLSGDIESFMINFNVGAAMMNPTAGLNDIKNATKYTPQLWQVEYFKYVIILFIIVLEIIAIVSFNSFLKEREKHE